MIGNVRVMSASHDTTHIRRLINHLQEAGRRIGREDTVGDLIDRAHSELLELEKQRDILVVSQLIGHWSVTFTDGVLKELREAAANDMSSDFVLRFVKGRKGQELIDTTYHNCSFYSCVVVFK